MDDLRKRISNVGARKEAVPAAGIELPSFAMIHGDKMSRGKVGSVLWTARAENDLLAQQNIWLHLLVSLQNCTVTRGPVAVLPTANGNGARLDSRRLIRIALLKHVPNHRAGRRAVQLGTRVRQIKSSGPVALRTTVFLTRRPGISCPPGA